MGERARITYAALLGLLWSAGAPVVAAGSQPVESAEPAPVADGPLQIVITEVTGSVSARASDAEPWARVQVGQQFAEGVELRTGPKSVVKFDIPPDSSITLDRLGTVKVVRAAIENGTIKTNLGMKYGRTRYDIETAGRPHDVQVRSPTSVLAVRGTDVILEDSPGFPPRAVSITGRATFRDAQGVTTPLGTPDANQPSAVESGTAGAADTARQQSVAASPIDAARTPNEFAVIYSIPQAAALPPPSGGGSIRSVQGGAPGSLPPPPGAVAPPAPVIPDNFLTGTLAFELRWTGNADLQIGVVSPLGEPVTTNPPAVLTLPDRARPPITTRAPSGGIASPDAKGGPAGSFVETITWPTAFPPGAYDYGVKYAGGDGPASYTLEAVVNGIRLDPPVNGTLTGPNVDEEFIGQELILEPIAPTATTGVRSAQSVKKPPAKPTVSTPRPAPKPTPKPPPAPPVARKRK